MKKYTKEELFKMDAVDVYKMVLKGDIIRKFPNGFWKQPEAKQNATKCTKYLIEEILKYDNEKLKEKNSVSIFYKNKLGGMLQHCFNSSPYEAINNAYPDKYKQWEFKTVPMGFWENKDNGIKATKWLIEDKLQLNDSELKEQLSGKVFSDNGLNGMLQICFNSSPYEAINSVYPNKFKEWEFNYVPSGYWTIDNGIKATKWLIEDMLKLDEEQLKEQLSAKLFIDNGLSGMLQLCFNASPYEAINATYPGKYKEWEFKSVPMGYWSIDNGVKATRWLIEEKLMLNDNELKEQLSTEFFDDNGLMGMLQYCFNSSPYEAINTTYPNKYKEWEFKFVPRSYWNKENSIKVIKWLIEEKLKFSDEELKEQLSSDLFRNNRLSRMLSSVFNNSPYEAINATYPNKFEKSDFKNYSSPFYKLK